MKRAIEEVNHGAGAGGGFLKSRFAADVYRTWAIPQVCEELPLDITRCIIAPIICHLEQIEYTFFDRKERKLSSPSLFNPYLTPFSSLCRLAPDISNDTLMFLYEGRDRIIRIRESTLSLLTCPSNHCHMIAKDEDGYEQRLIRNDETSTLHALLSKKINK